MNCILYIVLVRMYIWIDIMYNTTSALCVSFLGVFHVEIVSAHLFFHLLPTLILGDNTEMALMREVAVLYLFKTF